ncbi:MAG: WecB/TagA/CpsF family glycosyltransferase [Chloroflexota bacterium]|nr:WecB/TagA/CpsF family glycosyltransferase [Chloroflexota bacterium]
MLGVRVDDVTYNEALARCVAFIRSGEKRYVVTPNPEFVVLARHDAAFRDVLNRADLSIPDGGGLLLAARLFGEPLREPVRGTDLCYGLIEIAPANGWRVFLLGAAPGVAAAAGAALESRYPGLVVAGTFAGDGSASGDAATLAAVQRAGRCDLLLVAYGAGKQEYWIDRNLKRVDTGLAIGVGGVLDFMSGRVRRAPAAVRRAGLDWLFRLLVQPRRITRQGRTIPTFLGLTLLEAARRRARLAGRDRQAGTPESLPRRRT